MSLLHEALSRVWFLPDASMPVAARGQGVPLKPGQRFRVLSWNIQFGAGRSRWFFYDGGPDSRVSEAEVEHTLAGITALLGEVNADLVLLQEVDRYSQRTADIDQHERIRSAIGLACDASTPYFHVPFVPVPPHNPLGRVQMHLSVFSRFSLGAGERIALSPLREPVWRRAFNLRRALMTLPIHLSGGGDLRIFHTHLSAFSRGDGTLGRQVATVADRIGRTSGPALLAGDLNSLPPGDGGARLGAARVLYSEQSTPIQPLWDGLDVFFPPVGADGRVGREWGSYVPWGSNEPDRTIDYVMGRGVQVHSVRTVSEGGRWSDHLPIVLELSI